MVTLRKQGRVCTAYLDESWRPIAFADFESPPEFFSLIQTMDENEARQRYGANVRFIEAPKRIETAPAPKLSETELRAQMGQMGIPTDVVDRLVKQGTSAVVPLDTQKEVAMVIKANDVQELVIRELRILFAKYECVPDDPEVRAEVQYVVNFLLTIWPDLEPEVIKMKEKATKPRFKL